MEKQDATRPDGVFKERIGSTTYVVNVFFSKTSKETMNDKIMRMLKNDVLSGKN